jgi:hypothetical protein
MARSELAQHSLNRDPRPSDHGLPARDLGIDLDPLVRHLHHDHTFGWPAHTTTAVAERPDIKPCVSIAIG